MAIFKSSNSGIPFGNTSSRPTSPSTGQPYFNGELQRLELYTGAQYGWQNIVAETPGITGYTGTVLESNTTNTISITGTNFSSGAIATLIGTDGTEYIATTTTVNNLTSITAVFGTIPANKEPYDIRVTNPSNLYGVYYDILSVNDSPIWVTPAGSLGTFTEQTSISTSALSVTDEESNTITYSLASGSSLPSGLSLNSSTGVISGTLPSIASNTTYTFTINASDGLNTVVPRTFSITSNANPAPTGGTITTSGSYRVHTFTSNGTFGVSEPITVQYLVVAGGGSGGFGAPGGNEAGGGGAGGYRSSVTGEMSGRGASAESQLTLSAGNYSITVGGGGAGVNSGRNNGNNSTFHTITSTGGGAGGANTNGSSGGSGGGGSHPATNGGAGTTGQGYDGGTPPVSSSAGGGGGAGGAGGNGRNSGNGNVPATGGIGVQSSITGTATYYAGGGGGGNPGTANYGGQGGGGNGQGSQGSLSNGTDNTGGGGGGIIQSNGAAGGNGGSGIVIIRYVV